MERNHYSLARNLLTLNIIAFLIVSFMANTEAVTPPSSDDGDDYIREYNCDHRMHKNCAIEIFNSIFKTGTVTDPCCMELYGIGERCHTAFVYRALQRPENKKYDMGTIFDKAEKIWDKCYDVAQGPPSSLNESCFMVSELLKLYCENLPFSLWLC